MNWAAELSAQLDWHWANQVRPCLVGLTDDECFWELELRQAEERIADHGRT
jgi:hypothetical protein